MNDQNYKVLINIIGAVETGGQVYGKQRYDAYAAAYTNSPKEYTCTLGAFQFYGSEAKQLIQMIYNANPTEFKSIDTNGVIQAKLSTDWVATKWNPSSSQKSILIKLITTETGRSCQDKLVRERIDKYLNKAYEYGISKSDVKVLMMWSEIEHLGGLNPTKRIFNRASKPYTVESIMASLKKDQSDSSSNNQVGDKVYWSRHLKCQEYVNKYVVDEQSSSTKKKEINSKNFLNAVKSVYQTAHDNKYTYGDSKGIPPTSDKVISCDRLIAKALWDMGYTDQPTSTSGRSGICVDQMDSYLQKYGFVKTTKTSEIKPGAVVAVGSGTSPDHVFVVVSINGTKVSKYDMGSQQRINASQPFNNIELVEWSNKKFIAAYNCKQVEVSTPKNYLSIGDNGPEVLELQKNLNTVMKAGLKKDGNFGNATDQAVRNFQAKYGLVVDGQYGEKSKTKMEELLHGGEVMSTTIVDEFLKYIGVHEYDGIVATIQKWYYGSLVRDAWCATSTSYFANVAGILDQLGGKHEGVSEMMNACRRLHKNDGKFFEYPSIPRDLKKHDIIFFKRNGASHVAHLWKDSTYTGNGVINVLGGNQSDMICKKDYKQQNIQAVYRPVYGEITPSKGDIMIKVKNIFDGVKGPEVRLLQTILKGRGFKGLNGTELSLDGECGANTVKAINDYQAARRKQGVELGTNGKNDGSCGSKMWNDLTGGLVIS